MAFLSLIIKSSFRNPLRTILTSVGVAVAIVAFLFLRTFIGAYYVGAENAASDRLVVRNKISIIFPLPKAYYEKVKAVPGVTDVSWSNWFGGVYIDERNFFAQMAVDPETALKVYPELTLTDAEKQSFLSDRQSCIVGVQIAEKYGWKVGDRIPLKGTIYPGDWAFKVAGIYKSSSPAVDQQSMFMHWQYLDDQMPENRKNQLGLLTVRVADANQSSAVAQAIDKMFANSLAETRTESEKQFQLAFLSMSGTIIKAIRVVSMVVLAILALILGNTLAMATRERTVEYAVMRAIGFQPRQVVLMVLGEGFVIALSGVLLGVALALPTLRLAASAIEKYMGNFLGTFSVSTQSLVLAAVVALIEGMAAAAIPARRAGKIKLVDALRRIE